MYATFRHSELIGKEKGLTDSAGLSLVVAAGVLVGAVTWSAGKDSGTVCSVGRIVVDMFTVSFST